MQQTAGLQLTGHQAHSVSLHTQYIIGLGPTFSNQKTHISSAVRRLPSAVRTATPAFHVRSSGLFCSRPGGLQLKLPDLYMRVPSRSADSFRRDLKTLLFSIYQRTQNIRGFARGLGWRRRERSFAVISRRKICSSGPPGPAGGACVPLRNALSRPQPQHGGMEGRDEIRDAMGRGIAAKTTSVE